MFVLLRYTYMYVQRFYFCGLFDNSFSSVFITMKCDLFQLLLNMSAWVNIASIILYFCNLVPFRCCVYFCIIGDLLLFLQEDFHKLS